MFPERFGHNFMLRAIVHAVCIPNALTYTTHVQKYCGCAPVSGCSKQPVLRPGNLGVFIGR